MARTGQANSLCPWTFPRIAWWVTQERAEVPSAGQARRPAAMMFNQIGDLAVREMGSAQPAYSNSFDQFSGAPHKWAIPSTSISSRGRMAAAPAASPGPGCSTAISDSIR